MTMNYLARHRSIILYAFSLAALAFLLKWLEWRFLIMDYAIELYAGATAIVFTGLGIWLALKLARPKVITIEKEVIVQRSEFVFDENALNQLGISRRELDVLELMAEGLSNQQIAEKLFLSLNTIKTHSSKVFEKLEVERRTQAVVLGFSAMILAFAFIFPAIKNYRDKYNNGFVSFGKAFQIGLLISLIASTMYVISWAIEYHFYMPDFMDRYAAASLIKAQQSGLSAAKLAEKTAEIAKMKEGYNNPVIFALYTYAEILPVGIIVSIITALILKKSNTSAELATA